MEFDDAKSTSDDVEIGTSSIGKYREWFRSAVDGSSDWRDEAREDFDFVAGQQWSEADKEKFQESGRPAITINRIKPLINVLLGYQMLNRYDIDFRPRTSDDSDLCKVRKGVTKYVMDSCNYDDNESAAFLDSAIAGIGWFSVGYNFDMEIGDGEAHIVREDPFGMYPDPESHKPDFSDAKYICRAKWVDKDELKTVYPEHAEDIDMQCAVYDKAEKHDAADNDPLWYRKDLQKVRLVECWYKTREPQSFYFLTDGSTVPQSDIKVEMFLTGQVAGEKTVYVNKVKVCVFMDRVLLEDIDSPYQHGEFPFVPLVCFHFGHDDIPAGFVRDLKDPQREINRRRIQGLHILNTTGNGGGFIEEDAMSPDQFNDFKKNGAIPGHFVKVRPNTISQGKIMERSIANPPAALINAESQATADLTAISGINEALMGTDIPAASSGRAIELKQKQAITHIAPMFDHLRKAKKKIAYLLWGKRGHKGIIPQYYTDDKIYRVEGENGQQFIHVNQQVAQQDPLGNVIHSTLNDLAEGEFDIVVADTGASTTQRQAQMWSLVDAVQKLGVPGDLVFDIILDLSDLPNKAEIKQRWQQRQQAGQQQAQQQMQLEMIKNQNMNQSIAFKDAPLPIQFAMAAKQGLIDPAVAQYATQLMVQQMFPQLAQQMQQQAAQQNQLQQLQAQQQQQGQGPPQGGQRAQPSQMTAAAAKSIMSGMAPAAM